MYLHRKRGAIEGVYCATDYMFKRIKVSGLKPHSYFITESACHVLKQIFESQVKNANSNSSPVSGEASTRSSSPQDIHGYNPKLHKSRRQVEYSSSPDYHERRRVVDSHYPHADEQKVVYDSSYYHPAETRAKREIGSFSRDQGYVRQRRSSSSHYYSREASYFEETPIPRPLGYHEEVPYPSSQILSSSRLYEYDHVSDLPSQLPPYYDLRRIPHSVPPSLAIVVPASSYQHRPESHHYTSEHAHQPAIVTSTSISYRPYSESQRYSNHPAAAPSASVPPLPPNYHSQCSDSNTPVEAITLTAPPSSYRHASREVRYISQIPPAPSYEYHSCQPVPTIHDEYYGDQPHGSFTTISPHPDHNSNPPESLHNIPARSMGMGSEPYPMPRNMRQYSHPEPE
jgi:hypothetical protein